MQTLSTLLRMAVGLVVMAAGSAVAALAMLLLLPSRIGRVKVGNYFGKTVSRSMVWLSGCPTTVRGAAHLDAARPAIYVSNHTSIMDIFLASWLSPVGTVGVAKREVAYYPIFGQLYLLSGHLRIDRGDSAKAKSSLAELGRIVADNGLSIFLWPEGTRSRDGRLLPFKKGLVHLAIQTGLPIVPMVVRGAHRAWEKGSLRMARVPIEVVVLPAVDTRDWSLEHADAQLEQIHALFRAQLDAEQQPNAAAATPQRTAAG